MSLTPTHQLHLNTAAGLLQISEPMDAWHELECIAPLNRAKTEVLTVRLAVCRAPKDWEQAEELARTLIRREPHNIMHVVALAEVMGRREAPSPPLRSTSLLSSGSQTSHRCGCRWRWN